ncbi:DUF3791 domain-containing protein [Rummeliibacillus suwonensis]|jgi:hypothetical protein|uniref:DUF3791 domain-containing protein n=1 Tax=Rummeliibacillus suwonensis TaxID=1306154 RepID=UPI001AAE8E5D|nr:DUF3791 domain-containing protein [Rummeliibacillus suwonensis]MBO2536618.1 DUF3791 domain-containing protein [Rummeliibacillus suwonensis]
MSKQADFFIYLIERYAENKKTTAQKVLEQWDSLDLTNLIYDMYELYHVERLENAFDDIDELVSQKQG